MEILLSFCNVSSSIFITKTRKFNLPRRSPKIVLKIFSSRYIICIFHGAIRLIHCYSLPFIIDGTNSMPLGQLHSIERKLVYGGDLRVQMVDFVGNLLDSFQNFLKGRLRHSWMHLCGIDFYQRVWTCSDLYHSYCSVTSTDGAIVEDNEVDSAWRYTSSH